MTTNLDRPWGGVAEAVGRLGARPRRPRKPSGAECVLPPSRAGGTGTGFPGTPTATSDAKLDLVLFQFWLILLFGLMALIISPFVRSWEGFGLGLLGTLIGAGLLILQRWMDRNIK